MTQTNLLNFTVQPVRTRKDILDACTVRSIAYGHHVPEFGEKLKEPDDVDWDQDSIVFLARDKETDSPIGTVRVNTNTTRPLALQNSVTLPDSLSISPLAEITRLAVLGSADRRVKFALMKATYLFSMAKQVRWLVIGARAESLIRQYRMLGFTRLFEQKVPLKHAGNIPHEILGFDVVSAERNWHAAQHPLYGFMVNTHHRDIVVVDKPASMSN